MSFPSTQFDMPERFNAEEVVRSSFGADNICLHQLRHTFLSLAAEQGVHPSVMQKLAGHSNPNITMKIYTHVNVEAKKAAMEALQNAYMTRDSKAS